MFMTLFSSRECKVSMKKGFYQENHNTDIKKIQTHIHPITLINVGHKIN